MTDPQAAPNALGRYELVHLLGQGGMGEVYLAKISGAAGFEKPCIVKTILPALLNDQQFLERFHHEAKVLVHLVHSNIAQVYDMGEAAGMYFMALEYVAGVDVAHLLDRARRVGSPLPISVALYLGMKMAEGLGYAHRKAGSDGQPLGIVHRDVSPHNVMVSYEGEVKVIDFGLAKSAARSRHTLPSTVMGKLGYMSPEQARAEVVDHRSDIYSCGVVLWEMLSGRSLFAPGTMGELMAAMANPKPSPLRALRQDVPEALDAVVQKALAPNPADRFQRADDLARALNEQLLLASSRLGAEEVGSFIKELCPEDYSRQRSLISQLSLPKDRRSPPPGHAPPPEAAFGIAATAVRTPVSPVPPAKPPSFATVNELPPAEPRTFVPSQPVPSQPLPAAKPKSLVLPVLALLALVAASVGVTAVVMSGSGSPKAPATEDELDRLGEKIEKAVAERVAAETEAALEAVKATAADAPKEEVAAKAEEPAVDAGALSAPEPVAKKKDKPRKQGPLISVARVAEVFVDKGVFYAQAGATEGMEVGLELAVVGPPVEEGKREQYGKATLMEVHPKLSRLRVDAGAKAAPGKKFLALPAAPPQKLDLGARAALAVHNAQTQVAVQQPPPVSPPPEKKPLIGRATVSGPSLGNLIDLSMQSFTVFNDSQFRWTGCSVSIYPRRSAYLGELGAQSRKELTAKAFRASARARDVQRNTLGIDCAEGSAQFPLVSR